VDYLIIGHNSVRSMAEISKRINFKKLILDGTNSPWYVNRLEQESQFLNGLIHAVGKKNAFVLTL